MYTVYLIENTLNCKLYVGVTSKSLKRRWQAHRCDAGKSKYPLHCSIEEYGEEVFDLFILEKTESEETALESEIKYIEFFQTYEYGYNATRGGEMVGVGEENHNANLSDDKVVEAVNEYRTTRKTRKEVAEKYNTHAQSITGWDTGKSRTYLQEKFAESSNENVNRGVSDETAIKVVCEYRMSKKSAAKVGEKYDVSKYCVYKWHHGKTRSHLQEKIKARVAYNSL